MNLFISSVFVVVFLICSVLAEFNLQSYLENMPPKIKEIHGACLTEASTTNDELVRWKPGEKHTKGQLCFFKCFKTKTGRMKEDGTIDVNKMKQSRFVQKMNPEDQTKFLQCVEKAGKVTQCEDIQKLSDCATSVKLAEKFI